MSKAPTHMDFNLAPKHEHSSTECPECGYHQEEADDLHDEGKADSPHVWLLEHIEKPVGSGYSVVWCRYECLRCNRGGTFSVMGPRTTDDLARKQRDAQDRAKL